MCSTSVEFAPDYMNRFSQKLYILIILYILLHALLSRWCWNLIHTQMADESQSHLEFRSQSTNNCLGCIFKHVPDKHVLDVIPENTLFNQWEREKDREQNCIEQQNLTFLEHVWSNFQFSNRLISVVEPCRWSKIVSFLAKIWRLELLRTINHILNPCIWVVWNHDFCQPVQVNHTVNWSNRNRDEAALDPTAT